jgi:hypothetical protein
MWVGSFLKISFQTFFGWLISNPNLMQSKNKSMFYYNTYTIHTPIFFEFYVLNFISFYQIILDVINFVKIKISSPNTKSETQIKCNTICRNMFHIHVVKVPKVAPLVVCFHPTFVDGLFGIVALVGGTFSLYASS